jgi:PAS domain S-box-containing protein
MLDQPAVSQLQELPAIPVLEGPARLHYAVFASYADGRVVWLSDAFGALRGTEPTQDDRSWREGHPGRKYFAQPEQLEEIRRRLLREGQVHAAPAELLGCDGSVIPVEIDAFQMPVGERRQGTLVGIVRPCAERDRQQREAADLVSGILASAPTAVLAVDHRGFIRYANPAVQEQLGFAPGDLLDKPIALIGVNADRLAEALFGAETGKRREVELKHASGASRPVTISVGELQLGDGAAGRVVVLHDAREGHQNLDELLRKNDELEHYVQNVTHDLRSPLVSVLGFSRLLRQEYGEGMDDTARHFLDRIEKAGHAMEALINDLLELSRIESSRSYKAHVNVNDVLSQIRAELKPRLEDQNVRLVLPSEARVVLCDRTRLYQVFSNLIGNALDYMGPVSDPEIRIEVFEEPGEHHVVVRDNGRGIEPAQRERIFELFQSVGPRADGRRGTGIGLAIVKKIAQSQGGRVWAESHPGKGAAFHLTLPRQ